ncbi:MAG TPA: diaminopimelate decarboxylase [Acidimicrobiales bacterium]|nr:diaminopimelate decarboxylase [Acidimicrobiales bacterium]
MTPEAEESGGTGADELSGRADDPESEAAPVARHLLPITATRGPSGGLAVGGVDLVELAGEIGTPVFVYDEDHLRARCKEAVACFGRGAVAYGTKAFLCKAMAALAVEEGMLLDVSTGGELAVALAAGVPGDQLVLHGNNKSFEELTTALANGVGRIVVDSFDEIRRLSELARAGALSHGVDALIRVTPGVEAHTHEYVMTGQEDSKFGFSLAEGAADRAVEALLAVPGIRLVGAHTHVGSQIFRVDVYARVVSLLGPFLRRHRLEECCVGGGLGVAYVNGEHAPSMAEWASVVRTACAVARLPAEVRVTAEPGRSIVATAGLTLYRVGTIKRLPGVRTYVAVDGGMSDNPRPVLYGSGYEAFLPRSPDADRPLAVRVVGKHCESGDIIVENAFVPADVEVGDVLATPVTGAYGWSMASNYNRVGRPPVVFVGGGSARVVVRRESIEDLLRLDE